MIVKKIPLLVLVFIMAACSNMQASFNDWQLSVQEARDDRQLKKEMYTNEFHFENSKAFAVREKRESQQYGVQWRPRPERVFWFPIEINTSYETDRSGQWKTSYYDYTNYDYTSGPDLLLESELFGEHVLAAFHQHFKSSLDVPGVAPLPVRALELAGHPVLSTSLVRWNSSQGPTESFLMTATGPSSEFLEQVSDLVGVLGPGDALMFVFLDLSDIRFKEPGDLTATFDMGGDAKYELKSCSDFEGSHAARTVGFSALLVDYEGVILRARYAGFYFDDSLLQNYSNCGFSLFWWSKPDKDPAFTSIDPDKFWQSLASGDLDASWPSALDLVIESQLGPLSH